MATKILVAFCFLSMNQVFAIAKEEDLDKLLENLKETQKLQYEQIKEHLEKNVFNDGFNKKLKDFKPAVVDFATLSLKDEEALPAFFGIVKKRRELYYFLAVNIVIFLIGLLWKRHYRKFSLISFKYWCHSLSRFVLSFSIRIGSFIYLFKENIKPLYEIFRKSFFNT